MSKADIKILLINSMGYINNRRGKEALSINEISPLSPLHNKFMVSSPQTR